MSVALVTGASGFIGSHLVEALLARGDEVRCLVRPSSSREFLEQLGVQLVEGDVTAPETLDDAIDGVDVVYNLAGLVSAPRQTEQTRVNCSGVGNVARACAAKTTPPVHVLVSSVAAAGPAPRDRLLQESDAPHPISNYGRSKRDGERAAENLADRVPTTIVRPGAVFGERDRLMLPMFKSIARFHVHVAPGLFPPKLSVVYAGDLVRLLMAAADRGERLSADVANQEEPELGPVAKDYGSYSGQGYYFACSPEYPDVMQWGRLLAQALETRFVVYLPLVQPLPWCLGGLTEVGGRLLGKNPQLNIDKIREATATSWACSGEKAVRQLKFKFDAPLTDRLRKTAGWYREQRWL